jgi:hypothetical protein
MLDAAAWRAPARETSSRNNAIPPATRMAAEKQPAREDVSGGGAPALGLQHGPRHGRPEACRPDAKGQHPGLHVSVVGDDPPADAVAALVEVAQRQHERASAVLDER